jgi:hypothetical protein
MGFLKKLPLLMFLPGNPLLGEPIGSMYVKKLLGFIEQTQVNG